MHREYILQSARLNANKSSVVIRTLNNLYDQMQRIRLITLIRLGLLEPLPDFDADYYLQHSPDVANVGIDPYVHYRIWGWKEGRKPNSQFDVVWYLSSNPDVLAAGVEPLRHYINFGEKEGRKAFPPLNHNNSDSGYSLEPLLDDGDPGYDFILERLRTNEQFTFCKLNHAIWELFVKAQNLGYPLFDFGSYDNESLDKSLNFIHKDFATNGFLEQLFNQMKIMPDHTKGMYLAATLSPWPYSLEIEGTPFQNTDACNKLIRQLIPEQTLSLSQKIGFTGHEFKKAIITGRIDEFFSLVRGRNIIAITNPFNVDFFEMIESDKIQYIFVDAETARAEYQQIWNKLSELLANQPDSEEPVLVLTNMGDIISLWLAIKAINMFSSHHFIDLGGATGAFSERYALKTNWTKVYRRQILRSIQTLENTPSNIVDLFSGQYGLRDETLVEIACEAGVPAPTSCDYPSVELPSPGKPIDFIENKPYDFQRMQEFLTLSMRENHHANFGPVSHLLEKVIYSLIGAPTNRRVVAVNSGTSGLHIAAGLHSYKTQNADFRWITSAYNFFSSNIGPLANTQVIDCNRNGCIDLKVLKEIPFDQYDGLIYCNLFARNSNWSDIRNYCHVNGKAFIVDNAVGFFDRAADSNNCGDLEVISLHHTKPWGVGEGGVIICSVEDEQLIRHFANFGVTLSEKSNYVSSNYKMSDLAAAAILNRLEFMNYWSMFYRMQEQRIRSILNDLAIPLKPFAGTTRSVSSHAYFPLICDKPVDVSNYQTPVTLRKYYMPLVQTDDPHKLLPVANDLFSRVVCFPNNPTVRLANTEDIAQQLRSLVNQSCIVPNRYVSESV